MPLRARSRERATLPQSGRTRDPQREQRAHSDHGSSTGHGCRCQGVEWRGLRDDQHHPAVDEVSGSGGVSRGSLSGRAVG